MIRTMFTIQCDVCGDLFEQIRQSNRPEPNEWALNAGELNESSSMEGWYFNQKTCKHWCVDCLSELRP
jgi:hypothetical protein